MSLAPYLMPGAAPYSVPFGGRGAGGRESWRSSFIPPSSYSSKVLSMQNDLPLFFWAIPEGEKPDGDGKR